LRGKSGVDNKELRIIGPANANVARINDVYRKVIYIKCKEYKKLILVKDYIENCFEKMEENKKASIQFDFNPMTGF
jgi:primosomal protein N' (replication factor Y)